MPIEEDLRGPALNVSEIFQIVARGSRNVSPQVRFIACVDVNPEHGDGRMILAERVAVRRGVNVRDVPTLPDAGKWLGDQLKSEAK